MWMVYTEPGGGVSITSPSGRFMRAATNGGDRLVACLPIDEWVGRKTAQGHSADASYRHALAWWRGGFTTAEAWGIIRDIEPRLLPRRMVVLSPDVVARSFFPDDGGYFRRAWRRLESGGPIYTDIDAARNIHRKRMKATLDAWNKRAIDDDERESLRRLTNGPALIEWDWPRLRSKLLSADTPAQIRAVWPDDLPRRMASCNP